MAFSTPKSDNSMPEPFELKTGDIIVRRIAHPTFSPPPPSVIFGSLGISINIASKDNKTIPHHKVAACVVCILTEQEVLPMLVLSPPPISTILTIQAQAIAQTNDLTYISCHLESRCQYLSHTHPPPNCPHSPTSPASTFTGSSIFRGLLNIVSRTHVFSHLSPLSLTNDKLVSHGSCRAQ
jgi:hypothetical protein